jgi:hypothetical protein
MRQRVRQVRRPFRPSTESSVGRYRLPNEIRDRLTAALATYRNREAAFTLATFIARFWSVPGRVVGTFPIDRRALADHPELGLTEARVRGALRVLEGIGGSSVPSRALAEAMISRGAGAIAALGGREEAVQVLRAAADQLEGQS